MAQFWAEKELHLPFRGGDTEWHWTTHCWTICRTFSLVAMNFGVAYNVETWNVAARLLTAKGTRGSVACSTCDTTQGRSLYASWMQPQMLCLFWLNSPDENLHKKEQQQRAFHRKLAETRFWTKRHLAFLLMGWITIPGFPSRMVLSPPVLPLFRGRDCKELSRAEKGQEKTTTVLTPLWPWHPQLQMVWGPNWVKTQLGTPIPQLPGVRHPRSGFRP